MFTARCWFPACSCLPFKVRRYFILATTYVPTTIVITQINIISAGSLLDYCRRSRQDTRGVCLTIIFVHLTNPQHFFHSSSSFFQVCLQIYLFWIRKNILQEKKRKKGPRIWSRRMIRSSSSVVFLSFFLEPPPLKLDLDQKSQNSDSLATRLQKERKKERKHKFHRLSRRRRRRHTPLW